MTKNGENGDEGVGIGNLLEDEADLGDLDDSKSKILSSLIVETKSRTPMDLIQAISPPSNLRQFFTP